MGFGSTFGGLMVGSRNALGGALLLLVMGCAAVGCAAGQAEVSLGGGARDEGGEVPAGEACGFGEVIEGGT